MNMDNNVIFIANRDLALGFGISLHMVNADRNASVRSLVFEPYDEGAYVAPTVTISDTEGQNLMDTLWNVGIRPSEGSGSAGSLAATERHLEDMRTLVFHPPFIKELK